jgi:hypothetical protein
MTLATTSGNVGQRQVRYLLVYENVCGFLTAIDVGSAYHNDSYDPKLLSSIADSKTKMTVTFLFGPKCM